MRTHRDRACSAMQRNGGSRCARDSRISASFRWVGSPLPQLQSRRKCIRIERKGGSRKRRRGVRDCATLLKRNTVLLWRLRWGIGSLWTVSSPETQLAVVCGDVLCFWPFYTAEGRCLRKHPQPGRSKCRPRSRKLHEYSRIIPRLKNISQQKRETLVEFVMGNMLFVLLHELGHATMEELRIPVLGRE